MEVNRRKIILEKEHARGKRLVKIKKNKKYGGKDPQLPIGTMLGELPDEGRPQEGEGGNTSGSTCRKNKYEKLLDRGKRQELLGIRNMRNYLTKEENIKDHLTRDKPGSTRRGELHHDMPNSPSLTRCR